MPRGVTNVRCNVENKVFDQKKQKILHNLGRSAQEYSDASPKGSVDAEVADLVAYINSLDGCVTTSSCAGRVVVFAEGAKSVASENESRLGQQQSMPSSGKAQFKHEARPVPVPQTLPIPDQDNLQNERTKSRGGQWLFVSHIAIDIPKGSSQEHSLERIFGLASVVALQDHTITPLPPLPSVSLKFEPLILHVLTSSLAIASKVLVAANQAGFRESGVTSVLGDCPLVAIRTQSLALNCIIGVSSETGHHAIVDAAYLEVVATSVNDRFVRNAERKDKLQACLAAQFRKTERSNYETSQKNLTLGRESADSRRIRKREEGLRRQQESRLESHKSESVTPHEMDYNLDFTFPSSAQNT